MVAPTHSSFLLHSQNRKLNIAYYLSFLKDMDSPCDSGVTQDLTAVDSWTVFYETQQVKVVKR